MFDIQYCIALFCRKKKIHAVHCSHITKYYTNEKTILIAYNICASEKKMWVLGSGVFISLICLLTMTKIFIITKVEKNKKTKEIFKLLQF